MVITLVDKDKGIKNPAFYRHVHKPTEAPPSVFWTYKKIGFYIIFLHTVDSIRSETKNFEKRQKLFK